jgi:hypothetical protein
VHVNQDLSAAPAEIVSSDMQTVLPRLKALLDRNPDLAYSRIVCPRYLEPDTAYHAFLIPVFESGRLAGLNREVPPGLTATAFAWTNTTVSEIEFPFYYRWFFHTGTIGDFEYLVRLLQPKPVDSRVGKRDMDVQFPDANIRGITNPELGGILKLGGALKIPEDSVEQADSQEVKKYENWDQPYPHVFQQDLARFINLADDYSRTTPEKVHQVSRIVTIQAGKDPDPLITAPLYGRWHALVQRLLEDETGDPLPHNQNWVHRLNLDPRYRVAAGFGTQVIQKNQEEYMDAAWGQVGRILEANRRIRQAQLSIAVSGVWYDTHIAPMAVANPEKTFVFTAPLHKRVVSDGFTVHHQVINSKTPSALLSTPARRVLRPGGRLARSLASPGKPLADTLISRLNSGELVPVRPKGMPSGATGIQELADTLIPQGVPSLLIDLVRHFPFSRYLVGIAALIVFILILLLKPAGILLMLGVIVLLALAYLTWKLFSISDILQKVDSIREENQNPAAVDGLPKSPDFVVLNLGDTPKSKAGNSDSVQATRFKSALKDVYALVERGRKTALVDPPPSLNIPLIAGAIIGSLNPQLTIQHRINQGIRIPGYMLDMMDEEFSEVMAYPEFDIPMYKPLSDISADLFLPNINYVEQDSISLLETNQPFIEAYMVGLNHEFARELLWREYPTDQRGSHFRQFWDVSSYLDTDNTDPATLREKLKDIPPLHEWRHNSDLGDHDNREIAGEKDEELVLVIRGELLKKYPTAVIYATRARWQMKVEKDALPLILVPLTQNIVTALDNGDPSRALMPEFAQRGITLSSKYVIEVQNAGMNWVVLDFNDTFIIKKEDGALKVFEGIIDSSQERRPVQLFDDENNALLKDKIKMPLYRAKVDPDIYFLGFDLNVTEARGGTGDTPDDDPGWFFVIKERPGEPHFGLDIDKAQKIQTWNDLSWKDILPNGGPGAFIRIDNTITALKVTEPVDPADSEKRPQWLDDQKIVLDPLNAATMAYILFQAPVMVAVHAAEMLPEKRTAGGY